MINLTPIAQEEVKRLTHDQKKDYLRLAVKGGGCSGLTYHVELDDKQNEYDRIFEIGGLKVLCDSKSLVYLDGMTIDYSKDLVGGGFRFINPNATGSCGCGTSFSV